MIGSKRGRIYILGIITKIKDKIASKRKYRIGVKIVLVLMFLVGLYLIVYPLLPAILFKLFQEGEETYPYKTRLEGIVEGDGGFEDEDIPSENRLVIPAIGVDMPIVEGDSEEVLNLGVWHRPRTGIPGQGNMVLTGHRVGYAFLPEDIRNSTSFYHLDKLEIGSWVIIYWKGAEYDYQVYDFGIVDPTEVSVESQEGAERLTLYTCHPIGQRSQRLVYWAKPIDIDMTVEKTILF
jgi:LPXTG-site transpeptidase (sortase) family protein